MLNSTAIDMLILCLATNTHTLISDDKNTWHSLAVVLLQITYGQPTRALLVEKNETILKIQLFRFQEQQQASRLKATY